jgi:hypothetical protein
MPRKVIQIAVAIAQCRSEVAGEVTDFSSALVALCDDGSVWTTENDRDGGWYEDWRPVQAIPQPEDE